MTYRSEITKTELRLVVDNPNPLRPAVFHSRLGKLRNLLKKVTLISNGPYIPRFERQAKELADWVETSYWDYATLHPDQDEALIYLLKLPDENLRKKAVELLRGRDYRVTFSEIRGRPGGRFSVSLLKR